MPIETITGYKLVCNLCSYVWETRYSKIPASCPSCKNKIHNTNNYKILTQFIHKENTPEETMKLTMLSVIIFLGIWVIFGLIFGSNAFTLTGLILLIIVGVIFWSTNKRIEKDANKDKNILRISEEHTIKKGEKYKTIKTKCPKCLTELILRFDVENLKTEKKRCTGCGNIMSISPIRKRVYKCEYCLKEHTTLEDAEKHEKNCKK
ncbi:hypothetical protein HYY69_03285 [Candidatus Woesearchaeota archaeon]|nr:hypothetical protein [Candidatus Woesearchaeota archaeon]